MSFSASISGHLTDPESTSDDVIEAFDNFIRALRTVGADPTGSVSGTENGQPFSRSAADVTEFEAADTDDTDDSPESAEPAGAVGEDNDGEV